LNLFRFWHTCRGQGELIVLPSYRSLAECDLSRIASKFVGEQLSDLMMVGHGGDYFGSREYLPGMPVRRWDYNSWARLGQPIVREYSHPQQPTVALVIDTCLPQSLSLHSDDEVPEFEAILSLAAAISEALTAQHWRILLLTAAGLVPLHSSTGPANQHTAILSALAELTPTGSADFSQARAELGNLLLSPCAAFILLHSWDAARAELCDELVDRGSELTRIFISEKVAKNAGRLPGDVIAPVADIETGCVRIG
jgi:uncharacterized protein (DUF58 family)